jgi:hypothetical protein
MSGLAAYLCDERLPAIPYRQWVMSFPRIALPQCFGGRLNANPYFHTVVCDGAFFKAENADLRFFRLPPPTREELEHLTVQIGTRVAALLGSDWKGADHPDQGANRRARPGGRKL